MTRIWLYFVASVLIFSACVPAKKLVFLQKGDELKKRKDVPRDSILRSHTLDIREYQIQPLDILSVTFETLSEDNDAFDFLSKLTPQNRSSGGSTATNAALNGVLVDTHGDIEYAVLGKIRVGGLTAFQAQDSIRSIALKYLPDVIVRVRMLNFRYTMLGEVNGEKTVTSANTRLTFTEAIGQAGGLTEMADRTLVKVIRQTGSKVDVFYVNLLEEDFVESPYYYVQQNDVIIIPPLKQRTFRAYFTTNLAILTTTISFVLLIITLNN